MTRSVRATHQAQRQPADGLVTRMETITVQDFRRHYFRPRKPLLLTQMTTHWPAMTKWSFDFFRQLNSSAEVFLEEGDVLQGTTQFHRLKFDQFLNALMDDDAGKANTDQDGKGVQYLSLFNIFALFPELQRDVDFSLIRAHTVRNHVFAWLGPAGTLTGYHIDWIDNLFVQIHGRKRFLLVSPAQHACMYPSTKYDYRSTLSAINPEHYDHTAYPLFANVQPTEVIVNPGDMLYVPRGWWHRVQSLDKSISVNNFGHDLRGLLFSQSVTSLQDLLHRTGLYRRVCTCHMMVNGKRVAR